MTSATDLQRFLDRLNDDIRDRADWGKVADYIPQLAMIDPAQFAMTIAMNDGQVISAGQSDKLFSIQSISKVFTLACVLGREGDQIWSRVGREPSGSAFDSILLLEQERGRPRNPFINVGAIVTTDELLQGRAPREALNELLTFIQVAAGDDTIAIDPEVARSETETGFRNIALANYLKSFGNLRNNPDLTLGTYFHQCAIEMTTTQLALAGRAIAGLGDAPRVLSRHTARRLNALMMTCGHYDGSGDFAYRVGLPGKSGVGGGILLIAPGRASVAIWSPGLNGYGNSQMGTYAAERLATFTGWSSFG